MKIWKSLKKCCNYLKKSKGNVKIITRLRGTDKCSKTSKLLKLSENLNMNRDDDKIDKKKTINTP